MKCSCGFKFAEPGEFRNCDAFLTAEGKGGITCPECRRSYVDGVEFRIKEPKK